MNNTASKVLKLIVTAVVLLAVMIPASACNTKNNPSKVIHANAQLLLPDDYKTAGSSVCTVQIINEDGFDWHNVKLTVDELYVYPTRIELIKAGQTVTISLDEYLLADTPFDVKKYKPAKVGVSADEGSYFSGWTNKAELATK